MQKRRLASIKDVAAAAGVSVGTVSNVLNRPDQVGGEMRARVERTISDIGFVRNESARQLRMGKSRFLAYVMLEASNPFFSDVAQGIEAAAEAAQLTTMICNSGSDAAREKTHLRVLEQQRVQALLITPVSSTPAELEKLRQRGTAVVIVDQAREFDSFCSVAVDDHLGGSLAIEHLIDLGHRKVAFIGGPFDLGQVRDRWSGARQTWRDSDLPPSDLTFLATTGLDIEQGYDAGTRLLSLPSHARPTAVFCANDLIALGLLQKVMGSGVSVPEELSIVGYDDVSFASAAAVPLTSVRQPRVDIGSAAAGLALDEASNPNHRHQTISFTPELIARRSTAKV